MAAGRTRCCSTRPGSSRSRSGATAARRTPASPATPVRAWSSWRAISASTWTPPTTSSLPSRSRPRCWVSADAPGGRVSIIALDGIPEIRAGDELAVLLGDALERTAGVLPLEQGDVLVVTQKIVSKADGATVDLRTVEPRAEALEFGRRWDRDPRQVEVVLREARRVVRMGRGVIITETKHGFVCANGGVDASNVGPASGDVVTLLPDDPDASARGIRDALRSRFGHDLAVVISDS